MYLCQHFSKKRYTFIHYHFTFFFSFVISFHINKQNLKSSAKEKTIYKKEIYFFFLKLIHFDVRFTYFMWNKNLKSDFFIHGHKYWTDLYIAVQKRFDTYLPAQSVPKFMMSFKITASNDSNQSILFEI